MNKTIGYSLLLLLLTAFGCLPAQKVRPVKPAATGQQVSILAFSSEIDKQIHFLNVLLEENKLSDEDKKIATHLRDTYRTLQGRLSSQNPESFFVTDIYDLFKCVSDLDERYFSRKEGIANYSESISLFAQKKDDIFNAYVSGDFQAAIELCIELKTTFGPESLTPDIGVLFALSLAKKGMLDEAIDIGERVVRELETNPDIVQLRIGIAEWYLHKGEREKAISAYEKLADTLDEKGIEMQALSRKIAATEHTLPDSHQIPGEISSQLTAKPNTDRLIQEVEKLLEENRFSEARELLLAQKHTDYSSAQEEAFRQLMNKLDMAEQNYLEERISMLSMKQDMEQARRLLEEEKFEDVISMLDAMEAEQEESPEINELKQFAIEKLINRERNKAAKFFLAAKETRDLSIKEEDLQKALEILNAILEKYPSSKMDQKLKSHIRIVQEELAKLKERTETNREQ